MLAVATIFKRGTEIGKVTNAADWKEAIRKVTDEADWDDAIRIGGECISKLRGYPLSPEEIKEFTKNQYFQIARSHTSELELVVQIIEIE